MTYSDFEIAFSKPRIGRFLLAAKGDQEKALRLYKQNIQISQTLFGLLSIFEVTLRNKIDQYYRNYFKDNDWLKNNCDEAGIFSHPSFLKFGFETRTKILTTYTLLGKRYTHDRLVAELSFGFWSYMLAPVQFIAGGQGLHKIYIFRPKGTTQKLIFNELDEIRSLRNRIAQNEPLIFNKHDNVSTTSTNMVYDYIINQTLWLGFDPDKLFMGIDEAAKIIISIENEKLSNEFRT